jgi:hypothetical protein
LTVTHSILDQIAYFLVLLGANNWLQLAATAVRSISWLKTGPRFCPKEKD